MILRVAFAALLAAVSWNASFAQGYPDKAVHIIVGFGPGGPDTNARIVAGQLQAQTGKTFIVENKPGSAGVIGAEYVAKSKPDGYTLLATSASIASLPSQFAKLPFDVLKDFIPISMISQSEASFLVVAPNLPVKNVKEFIAYAKDPKNRVVYGTSGIGTGSHLRMALFAKANNINLIHAPFKSPGEAVTALMGGEIAAMFVTVSQGLPVIKAGKVRAIGYDYDTRTSLAPDVPTLAEAGAQATDLDSGWSGLLAPAGTPPEVVAWLETEVRKAVQSPDVQAKLKNVGLIPVGGSSADYAKALKVAIESMSAASKAAGIEPK
jgi:tripartite-type tricarboxylate transporter receptor subunit TctC